MSDTATDIRPVTPASRMPTSMYVLLPSTLIVLTGYMLIMVQGDDVLSYISVTWFLLPGFAVLTIPLILLIFRKQDRRGPLSAMMKFAFWTGTGLMAGALVLSLASAAFRPQSPYSGPLSNSRTTEVEATPVPSITFAPVPPSTLEELAATTEQRTTRPSTTAQATTATVAPTTSSAVPTTTPEETSTTVPVTTPPTTTPVETPTSVLTPVEPVYVVPTEVNQGPQDNLNPEPPEESVIIETPVASPG